MSQVTLYLDQATEALMERAARARGLSKSRFVAEIIRRYAADDWPETCLNLAGRFADFPLQEDAPAGQAQDVPRIGY